MKRPSGHRGLAAFLLSVALLAQAAVVGAGNPFGARGFRFGYSTSLVHELSKADAQAALELWAREFSRASGNNITYRLTLYDDLESLVAAIRDGQVDFIGLGALEYLKIRKQVTLEPALFGIKDGKPGEEYVLLVRRESGISALEQLRGRKVTTLKGESGEIASLWLDSLLADRGLPPAGRLFGGIRPVPKALQAILPVFFGQANACLVGSHAFRTAAELNPQIGENLVPIAASPVFPIAVTCIRTSLTTGQKEEFFRVTDKMKNTVSGKQILKLFKVDDMQRGTNRTLETLAGLLVGRHPGTTASRGRAE